MCEKKKCLEEKKVLCSCEALKSEDIGVLLFHVAENMQDTEWEFDYTTLFCPEPRRLCVAGTCRRCGGRLCCSVELDETAYGDDLLAMAYRRLYQYDRNANHCQRPKPFQERFVDMFHKQDRAFIREWLDRPENRSVHTMYRRRHRHSM